jgi:hypothetical protein
MDAARFFRSRFGPGKLPDSIIDSSPMIASELKSRVGVLGGDFTDPTVTEQWLRRYPDMSGGPAIPTRRD